MTCLKCSKKYEAKIATDWCDCSEEDELIEEIRLLLHGQKTWVVEIEEEE